MEGSSGGILTGIGIVAGIVILWIVMKHRIAPTYEYQQEPDWGNAGGQEKKQYYNFVEDEFSRVLPHNDLRGGVQLH